MNPYLSIAVVTLLMSAVVLGAQTNAPTLFFKPIDEAVIFPKSFKPVPLTIPAPPAQGAVQEKAVVPINKFFATDSVLTNAQVLAFKGVPMADLIEVLKWSRDRDLVIGQMRDAFGTIDDCVYRSRVTVLRMEADKIEHDERMEKRLREILQKLEAK